MGRSENFGLCCAVPSSICVVASDVVQSIPLSIVSGDFSVNFFFLIRTLEELLAILLQNHKLKVKTKNLLLSFTGPSWYSQHLNQSKWVCLLFGSCEQACRKCMVVGVQTRFNLRREDIEVSPRTRHLQSKAMMIWYHNVGML